MGGPVPIEDIPEELRVSKAVPLEDIPDHLKVSPAPLAKAGSPVPAAGAPAPRSVFGEDSIIGGIKDIASGKGIFGGKPDTQQHPNMIRPALGIAGPIAAQLIPGVPELEGAGLTALTLRALATGGGGAIAEIFNQGVERAQGKRKEMDWPAVGRALGLNTAFEFAGGLGQPVAKALKAGKFASQAPEVAADIAAGRAVSTRGLEKQAATTAETTAKEAEAKTMLDNLGQRLGMTEEQSAGLTQAYTEGRQVGDAFYKADRQVAGEFKERYDAVLKGHENDPVAGVPIASGIGDTMKWLDQQNLGGQVRPALMKRVANIAKQAGAADIPEMEPMTVDDVIQYRKMNGLPEISKQDAAQWIAQMEKEGTEPLNVAKARGWQSELRAVERSQSLTEPEKALVRSGERSLNHSIEDAVPPDVAKGLRATDADYGVFKSNFRTFWKALKDKKSLQEVGDAIYDQMGKRPDALRYMLNAADRAGRMDDMRMAFANKIWRESQVPGGAFDRAAALRKYVETFGPGAKGNDVLHMVFPNQTTRVLSGTTPTGGTFRTTISTAPKGVPGISETVGQFVNRLEDMSRAQEVVKDSAFVKRVARNVQFRIILGSMVGGGLTYSAFGKDPAKAVATGLTLLVGLEGLNAVMSSVRPGLATQWAKWVTANPKSEGWITRGTEILGTLMAEKGKELSAAPGGPGMAAPSAAGAASP